AAAGPAELSASRVPLVVVAERLLPGWSTWWLSVVALLAVTNTALFNLIMASRLLFGMAREGWAPAPFGRVHAERRTPTWGVAAAFLLATGFALTGVLQVLAEATNVIILTAFFAVNLSLVVIRVRRVAPDDLGAPPFRVPLFVPVLGMITTAYLALRFSAGAYARAGGLLLFGLALHLAHRLSRA